MAEEFDLVVIGGGPGGYAAALYAAGAGMSVAVVEKDKVGGTCLHRGCIPAKHYLETASVFRTVAGAKEFGVQADQPTLDLGVSRDRKQKVVDQLWNGLQGLMRKRKIKIVAGTGTLAPGGGAHGAGHLVTVDDGTELRGAHVVLATGSVPRTIGGFEPDGETILTSDHVLELDKLPASAAVIGGGAIGCEFASMLSDLGCEVTLLEALPKLLPGCDTDVVEVVVRSFKKRGMTVRTGVTVEGHERSNGQVKVRLADGESVTVDTVVVSVGRRPLTDGLGLDATAVAVDERGFINVDSHQRTAEQGVYAVGDVVATPQLAHVGFAEAIVAVRDMRGEDLAPVDYGKVPWCIYCHPEVAFAGMTEQAARDAGHDVVVSKHSFGANSRAMIIGETEGLVKVIAAEGGAILGVHMVGPWVTEQIGEGWLSVNWEATPDDMGQLLHPHPTLSETFGETVLSLTGRGLHG
ncbi:MAG: dihydrolipoyl dehydrogenase [Acidimicrobiales bacterium]